MRTGTVKWYDVRKGFGFITDEDGKDVFVHYTGLTGDGFRKLKKNAAVEFELGSDENGREIAINVVSK